VVLKLMIQQVMNKVTAKVSGVLGGGLNLPGGYLILFYSLHVDWHTEAFHL